MTPEQFISNSVGKPWVNRATGPNSYDCWGVVVDYYKKVLGLSIPDVADYSNGSCDVYSGLYEQDSKQIWSEIDSHQENCVFIVEQNDIPSHVGLIVNGRCLHAPGNIGNPGSVGYHSISAVQKAFGELKYWRYNNG